MQPTAADLIAAALIELGVTRVFGREFPADASGLDNVPVEDADLALLLADVDGRVNNRFGAAFIDGSILHVSSQPGGPASTRTVGTPEGACAAIAALNDEFQPMTLALYLDLDLRAPVDAEGLDDLGQPRDEVVVTLSPALADLSIVAVVGPGVVRSGHVAGLVEVAQRGGIGVFNTFGAKGVFRWDSPLHFGTIGLQERDLDLASLAEYDIVITSGLDPHELPPGALADFVVQDVAPWQLPALLADWPRARRDPGERPPLYSTISSIVTPMYERDGAPLAPPRAALQLAGAGPDNAVVAADAGLAGFWIARTFPTGTPGSAVVPAYRQPGFAAAAALVARLDGRSCVGITDGPLDEASDLVLEAARSMSVPVALQVWGDGDTDAERHLEVTQAGFAIGASESGSVERIDHIGVDGTCLQPLVDSLGSISAWEI